MNIFNIQLKITCSRLKHMVYYMNFFRAMIYSPNIRIKNKSD